MSTGPWGQIPPPPADCVGTGDDLDPDCMGIDYIAPEPHCDDGADNETTDWPGNTSTNQSRAMVAVPNNAVAQPGADTGRSSTTTNEQDKGRGGPPNVPQTWMTMSAATPNVFHGTERWPWSSRAFLYFTHRTRKQICHE
jgi:hypothetical protein